ncbi:MAG: glycosyl hydrolase family 18 protein [Mangrovibacterium sp.]
MEKYIWIISACFVILFACQSNSENEPDPSTDTDPVISQPYVVAYLPTWKMPHTPDWKKITHICLAFGIVQADGSLNMTEISKYTSVIQDARKNKVKVLLSIGGGGSANFTAAITDPAKRTRLVSALDKAIKDLDLDGIDMDYEEWEGGPGGASAGDLTKRAALESTYRELREKIGNNQLITAAVNADWDDQGWGYYNCFNNTMHQYLDFVSLMVYDETGPWSGSNVGPHSGWDFFEHAADHWLKNRKLPKEKLVMGVPFYGYLFKSANNAEGAEAIAYRDILVQYPSVDAHLMDNIGLLYYDGMPTIERKANYIKSNQLGGMMFWEITQDSSDPGKSLLNVIHQSLKK